MALVTSLRLPSSSTLQTTFWPLNTMRGNPSARAAFATPLTPLDLSSTPSARCSLPPHSLASSGGSPSWPVILAGHPASAAFTMHMLDRVEETVYPLPSQHPPLHHLSEIDQLLPPDMAIPILLFFQPPQTDSAQSIVTALKRSLSQLLSTFYPMAGRLVEREGAGGRLDVSCLDQGVPFSEAWADCSLSFFGPDFQPHPAFHLLSPLSSSATPDALFHVQVTHFTCGGICVCVQYHHILSDGVSFYHFLEAWVEILNGKQSLALYPHMDLSILREAYKLNEQQLPSSQYAQNFQESYLIEFGAQGTSQFISKIFSFTPSFLQALKEEEKTLHGCTIYECIVAYLWKHVTMVHQYPYNEMVRLAYPMDIRKRLKPCLPPGYFGNALFTGFAYAKVEDLVTRPLSYAMKLVREATFIMTNDYIKLALDWLNKQQSPTLFSIVSEKSLFANSWLRFPLCDLNFPWGKPCCFRTHLSPNLAGEFVLFLPSTLGEGHLDVQVNLKSEHMIKFEALVS